MKYDSDVPWDVLIRMNMFRFLPGDRALRRYRNTFYHAKVVEVGSANPEFVLNPKDKDAGVITWARNNRKECRLFLRGDGHINSELKLSKSMWIILEYTVREESRIPCKGSSPAKKCEKLYTYEIEVEMKNDRLRIL